MKELKYRSIKIIQSKQQRLRKRKNGEGEEQTFRNL